MSNTTPTPAPQPAADEPAKKPDRKTAQPVVKPAAVQPRTHCPRCRAAKVIHAKEHCPGNKRCTWRICECGTTWNPDTGRHYPPMQG